MQNFVSKFLLKVSYNVRQIATMNMWRKPATSKCIWYPFHPIKDKSDSPIVMHIGD